MPRRSDMTLCWAGLSTDLIFEQVSVRRNARELALGVGVLAILVCVCTNKTIQNFCDVSYEIGDQHNGTISMRDIRSFRIPIIDNGVIAQQKVNAGKAREIGVNVL